MYAVTIVQLNPRTLQALVLVAQPIAHDAAAAADAAAAELDPDRVRSGLALPLRVLAWP